MDPKALSAMTTMKYGDPTEDGWPAEEELVSPFRLVNVVLTRWRQIVAFPLVVTLLVLAWTFSRPRTYTATGSFVPKSGESVSSRLSNLAAQFGIDAGGGSNVSQSPAFYRTLLLSDEILSRVATGQYSNGPRSPATVRPLSEILEVDEPSPGRVVKTTVDKLREIVSVSVDRETGLVQISARTRWAPLSLQLVDRMISLVNEFNLHKRQEQATAERAFIQEQVDKARAQLRLAEDALQHFLQSNRLYQGDPQLVFAYDRLRREVEMRQSVYTTLSEAYERTTLDALRDTPVITTVQRPVLPPVPDRRGAAIKLVVAFVFGAFFATLLVIAGEYVQHSGRRDPMEYAKLQAMRQRARNSMRSLLRKTTTS